MQKQRNIREPKYPYYQDMENMKEQIKDELMLEMSEGYNNGYRPLGFLRRNNRKSRFTGRGRYYDQYSYDPNSYESLQRIMEMQDRRIKEYLNDLRNVKDPNVRRILRNLIMEERKNQQNAINIMNEMHNPYDYRGTLRDRMNDYLAIPENRNFLLGAGAGVLGLLLLPGLKSKMKNLVANTARGVAGISEQAQELVSGIKEDMEDIVAEAQFDNFKKEIENEINNHK